ncbi:MAG: hypothetical protein LBQ71_20580 [Hungatella sp.]|nr:hypothetical protein [Hungatella sp.]
MRFYDKDINFLYPGEDVWPSDDLFPIDDTPMLTVGPDQICCESFSLTQTICDNASLTFGQCGAAMVEVTVADVLMDLTGKWFALSIEVGGYEMMLGIYKVDSFERQADRRLKKIVAYDRMLNFAVDVAEWYQGLTFPAKVFGTFGGPKKNKLTSLHARSIWSSLRMHDGEGREGLQAKGVHTKSVKVCTQSWYTKTNECRGRTCQKLLFALNKENRRVSKTNE